LAQNLTLSEEACAIFQRSQTHKPPKTVPTTADSATFPGPKKNKKHYKKKIQAVITIITWLKVLKNLERDDQQPSRIIETVNSDKK